MAKTKPLTISQAFEFYKLDAKARLVTTATLRTYDDRLSPFVDWCKSQNIVNLANIKADTVRSYFVHLNERKLSDYTINGVGRALRAWFNFLVAEKLIEQSPMATVKVPKVGKHILPSLSVDDVKRLLEVCETERDEAIILFLLDTGIRATELVSLNCEDIDHKTGAVLIRQGKGRKDRTVYIGKKTQKQVFRYLIERGKPDDNEPLWLSEKRDTRLTNAGLRQLLLRLGKAAKVKRVSPHTFRRTFAINSLRNGMSIYHLQRLMGHADIHVLKQYLDLAESDAKAAHEKYGVVDNLK